MLFSSNGRARQLMPRWPRDWEPMSAYLSRKRTSGPPAESAADAVLRALKELPAMLYWGPRRLGWRREGGYLAVRSGRQMIGSGAIRLGRLHPANFIERLFPLEVWVPRSVIYQHVGINGPPGAGKTTTIGYAVPFYAALAGQSVLLNDVKSTEFFAWFVDWYRKNGHHAINFAPWTPNETLAAEPIHAATREELDIIVDALVSSAKGKGGNDGGGNADFFNKASKALLTGFVVALRYLPRRYCTLGTLYRVLASGDQAASEMLNWIETTYPTLERTEAAAVRLVAASEGELEREWLDPAGGRHPRAADVQDALDVIDRSGHEVMRWVRDARAALWTAAAVAAGRVTLAGAEWDRRVDALRALYQDHRRTWEINLSEMRTVISQPDQTFQNIVMGAANALSYLKAPELQRAFSRPEFDIHEIVKRPTFCVLGTMQAKKEVGAKFIGNLFTTLALNLVYERSRQRNFDITKALDVLFLLDEMPQLGIFELPNICATIRSYKGCVISIWQSDGQLKGLWNEDYTTVLDTHAHQLVLHGTDGLAAQRAVERIGKAVMMKVAHSQSRSRGKDGAISDGTNESAERVERMTAPDVTNVILNGKSIGTNGAIYVGKPTPAFVIDQIPFWEDPVITKGLECQWKSGMCVPKENRNPFRRVPLYEVDAAPPGSPEPWVFRRDAQGNKIEDKHATDPLRDTVDFLAPPEHTTYYELTDPVWRPEEIGITPVTAAMLQELLDKKRGTERQPATQGGATAAPPAQTAAAVEKAGVSRPAFLPWITDMVNADSGCPQYGRLPYAMWAERRFGWREAAEAIAEARIAQRGCFPRPLQPTPLPGAIALDWFLVHGLHHAMDYPSWAFMWLSQAKVAPAEPAAIRETLFSALAASELCFGGIAAPEVFFGPWAAVEDALPPALRDQTDRFLETARDRLADVADPAELGVVWAECRAELYGLVPTTLTPDAPDAADAQQAAVASAIAQRFVLAELLIDYGAYSRAIHMDLMGIADPEVLSLEQFRKAFNESKYEMPAKKALVAEMTSLAQLVGALTRVPRRRAGMDRLHATVQALGSEAAVAERIGVTPARAAA